MAGAKEALRAQVAELTAEVGRLREELASQRSAPHCHGCHCAHHAWYWCSGCNTLAWSGTHACAPRTGTLTGRSDALPCTTITTTPWITTTCTSTAALPPMAVTYNTNGCPEAVLTPQQPGGPSEKPGP